ncbi:MAG: hypothetical protein PHQ66_00560 [Candidatus Nanoarchaeia archaeon]|nr:hypothetical protein [Candidatus Nanoarchaeia archaeon]MDD5358062.1 hypothetical protein [Candidatus Nanoarchaeia archaeon]MDD5589250.1 hypothetical protein [Candidatus Nanoarchaeia archaeon]
MATEKEMNQASFIKIAKEINAYSEIIKSRQNQKQVILNDFDKERGRYRAGKISKASLASSVPRVRKELQRLNDEIRRNIRNLNKTADRAKRFATHQIPKNFKVSLTGISLAGGKKKKRTVHRTRHRTRTRSRAKKKR